MTKETDLQRVIRLIKENNISNYELAKNTNLSEAGIGKIVNGKTVNPHKNSVTSLLNYILKKYGSADGESDAGIVNEPENEYKNSNANQSRKSDVIIRDKFDDGQKGVPALPIKVQGGFTRHFSDPVFWKDLERVFIPGMPYDGDEYLWAEMEGDSMEYIDPNTGLAAGIPDRAWCIYQRVPQEYWRRGLRQFYVYLVITETRFTVKRILQDNDEEIVLSPDNEDYPQERVHLSEVQGIYIFKRKLDWNAPPPRKHEIKV